MEDQLCRGRVVVLQRGLYMSTECDGLGISQVVQAKVRPHLCFAWGHFAWAIKWSEVAATCAVLGGSQAKLSCESRLAVASARPGAH